MTDNGTAATLTLTRLERQVQAWRVLLDVSQDLAAELELERLLEKILHAAKILVDAQAGSLLLHDSARNALVFRVVEGGGGGALKNKAIRANQGLAGACFTSRQPFIVEDAQHDKRFLKGFDQVYGFHTTNLIAVPLVVQGTALGVIEIMNKNSGAQFDADDQAMLMALASQSAIAIQNARLYDQVVRERDRLVEAEATARHELARDLHDGPTQLVSAMVMSIRFLREIMKRAPERAESELIELEAIAQKTLYQIRNVLFDLHPIVLEKQGLRAALESYADRLRLLEPFTITVTADELTARWPPRVETSLFYIVQEAVTNVKKHANAHNLWIVAGQKDGEANIAIKDDGQGFDVAQVEATYATRGSLGLLSMRERAEVANADLQVDSALGRGTTIALRVPLEKAK
jgi:signal transduction histidine kinase